MRVTALPAVVKQVPRTGSAPLLTHSLTIHRDGLAGPSVESEVRIPRRNASAMAPFTLSEFFSQLNILSIAQLCLEVGGESTVFIRFALEWDGKERALDCGRVAATVRQQREGVCVRAASIEIRKVSGTCLR